jgi:hypothetical protein
MAQAQLVEAAAQLARFAGFEPRQREHVALVTVVRGLIGSQMPGHAVFSRA